MRHAGSFLIPLCVWLASAATLAAEEPTSVPATGPFRDNIEFFQRRIRPLLAEHCWKCHGEAQQEYGLRLDSRAGVLAGSDGGPVVVEGKPADSRLVEAVRYEDAGLQLPP